MLLKEDDFDEVYVDLVNDRVVLAAEIWLLSNFSIWIDWQDLDEACIGTWGIWVQGLEAGYRMYLEPPPEFVRQYGSWSFFILTAQMSWNDCQEVLELITFNSNSQSSWKECFVGYREWLHEYVKSGLELKAALEDKKKPS